VRRAAAAMPPRPQEVEYEEEDLEENEEGDEGDDYEEADEGEFEGMVEEGDEEAQGEEGDAGEGEEEESEEEDDATAATPWTGLAKLPEREAVISYLQELAESGFKQLNVLLLGKSSVGKSSTVNSVLGEAAARVQAFKLQADAEMVTPFVKAVGEEISGLEGMRIKLIDTCGLEDPEAGDAVHYAALRKIADSIKGQSIDCVLFVDRLDLYRVDALDKSIIQAVTDTFGASIWKKAVLVLTHGNLAQTPPGTDYDSFADRRVAALRKAIRGRNPLFRPRLPAVLVENNAETCPTDKEGRRLLPDGSQWVVSLMDTITGMATAKRAYRYRPGLTRRPNQRFKWMLPFVLAAQWLLWRDFIQPRMVHDKKRQSQADEYIWTAKADQRKRLGIGPPLKPTAVNAWRLEQIYEDD